MSLFQSVSDRFFNPFTGKTARFIFPDYGTDRNIKRNPGII